MTIGKRIGPGIVFLWFFIGGISHFVVTDVLMHILPRYIPWPRAAVLISGICELAGAVGLLFRPTHRPAGWALFLLTLAVTPANIYMLQRHDLFAVPLWILIARLPLQVVLLAMILWTTNPAKIAMEQ